MLTTVVLTKVFVAAPIVVTVIIATRRLAVDIRVFVLWGVSVVRGGSFVVGDGHGGVVCGTRRTSVGSLNNENGC